MKKLISLFLLMSMIIITACNDGELNSRPLPPPPPDTTESEPSGNISQEEAIAMAEKIAADINTSGYSRAASRMVDRTNISVISTPNSRSGLNDTLIYLINYTDNQGFAAISAVKCESPILAVIDESNYQAVKDADNPGFNMFMDMATEFIIHKREEHSQPESRSYDIPAIITPMLEQKIEIDTTYKSIQTPKLGNRNWGQNGIEGSLCPNKLAGCGPVAIAMVLSYYKIPSWIGYTYPNADIAGEDLDWDLINNHLPYSDGNCYNCSYYTHSTIARILREIGHRADTKYKTGPTKQDTTSSTSESNTKKILQKYLPMKKVGGYSDFNETGVKSAITDGLALIAAKSGTYSYSKFEEDGGGHGWVADGYRFITRNLRYYEKRADESTWTFIKNETQSERLFHFNWGWHGLGNGYYSGSVFCVIYNVKNPDTGKTETKRDYYSNAKYLSIL